MYIVLLSLNVFFCYSVGFWFRNSFQRQDFFFLDKSAKEIVIHRVVYSVAYEEKVLAVVLELKTAPPRSKG